MIRRKIIFHGRVQGVGFRITSFRLATNLKLTGYARNEMDGTVTMEVQGDEENIDKLVLQLKDNRFIVIDHMDVEELPVIEEKGFQMK